MKEFQEYQKKITEARARAAPPMPPAVAPPVFTAFGEIERKACKLEEVKAIKRTVTPDGAIYVQLECPGGATRERVFTEPQARCYYDVLAAKKVVEKKEAEPCEKVKTALYCTNSLTPTLTEQFTGKDVKREEAHACLDEMLKRDEVSAEHTWKKYRTFPPRPPRVTPKQLHDQRLGQYFAGEPIHSVTPETGEKWEKEVEETVEKTA